MAWPTSNFPSSLDAITDKVDNVDDVSASDINGAYDCIEHIEAKVGVTGSAVTSSLDYKLTNSSSINPGHKHTLAAGISDFTMSDDAWIGLGSSAGRIVFDNQTRDEVLFMDCDVGINTVNPMALLQVEAENTTPWSSVFTSADVYMPYTGELMISNTAEGVTESFASIFFVAGYSAGGSEMCSARIAALRETAYNTSLAFSIRGSGGQNEAMRITSGKYVGIGTTTPANPLAVNRSGDGVIVDFESADTVEGTVSISGSTTSYNAFVGSHYTQLKPGQGELPVGAVVVSTGEIIPCSTENKEYFVYVDTTETAGDKRAYGVWLGKMSDNAEGMSFGANDDPVYLIAQVGLFKIRVTDTEGDIANGDYLETSTRRMEAQKQTSDIKTNRTLAKSMVDVIWADIETDPDLGYKWTLIPCTF